MVVRNFRGRYPVERHAQITARLSDSGATPIPALRAMAGSHEASATMIDLSVRDTREHAQAMTARPEMAPLARQFIAMGVDIERPIIKSPVLWSLPAAQTR
jgi:hypothetical protein